EPEGITSEQFAALRRLAARIPRLYQTLRALDLPDSIEHGDLWPSNVFLDGRQTRILDWTDASVAHPFLSVLLLVLGFGFSRPRARNVSGPRQLRDAYLEPWQGIGARRAESMLPAFETASPLAALHYGLKVLDL